MPLLVHLGDVYVKLLFTAVTISLSRLLLNGRANRYIGRLVVIFVVGLVLAGSSSARCSPSGHAPAPSCSSRPRPSSAR